MSHINHIAINKNNLIIRFQIIRLIREFFWSKNFLEVETPNIVRVPGQEPYLSPMPVGLHNEKGEKFQGYLHTSPEYTMKKMLAAGFSDIFSICKCYRDYESFGGTHNPEFTMIEWYRSGADMFNIMEDIENLFAYIAEKMQNDKDIKIQQSAISNQQFTSWERITMKDLWQKYVGVNLDNYLDSKLMFNLCQEKKYNVTEGESYEDLFYRIFLNEIEPSLGKDKPTIVYNYPAQMAALSQLSKADSRYAERFEVYIQGLELANAFSELTDSKEQLSRLKLEQEERRLLGKEVYGVDEEFISALNNLSKCSGIALGVDRLVQLFTGCQNIDDVLVLPASKLFKE